MSKIKRIMRLSHEAGCSQREIARAWPLPEGLDEPALAARLYGERPAARRAEPDFAAVRKQLKKYRHVTLERLWQEDCADQWP